MVILTVISLMRNELTPSTEKTLQAVFPKVTHYLPCGGLAMWP